MVFFLCWKVLQSWDRENQKCHGSPPRECLKLHFFVLIHEGKSGYLDFQSGKRECWCFSSQKSWENSHFREKESQEQSPTGTILTHHNFLINFPLSENNDFAYCIVLDQNFYSNSHLLDITRYVSSLCISVPICQSCLFHLSCIYLITIPSGPAWITLLQQYYSQHKVHLQMTLSKTCLKIAGAIFNSNSSHFPASQHY